MHVCHNGLCYHRKIALFVVAAAVFSAISIAWVSMSIVSSAAAGDADENRSKPTVMREKGASTKRGEPVAVVELFTSEGCSSCPPADRNLQRLAKLGMSVQPNLIPLSFHVDYWNNLGWKDPLSNSAYTDRQREYAVKSSSNDVYTPQMIVNGQIEFVGSNQKVSDKAVALALQTPVRHLVDLTLSEAKSGQQTLQYQLEAAKAGDDAVTGYVLNVAIVSDEETVHVPRGENSGRTLKHAWVVKNFEVVTLKGAEGVLKIDSNLIKPGHTRLVGYVQSTDSLAITGASAIDL